MDIISNPGSSQVTLRMLLIFFFLKQVGYLVQAVENPEQKAELPGVQSVGDALRSP